MLGINFGRWHFEIFFFSENKLKTFQSLFSEKEIPVYCLLNLSIKW